MRPAEPENIERGLSHDGSEMGVRAGRGAGAGGGVAVPAGASPIVLNDLNSQAQIDLSSDAGMYSWTVDGVEQLYRQWFWIRQGDTAANRR